MDHLVVPEHQDRLPIQIPVLGANTEHGEAYDDGPHMAYPGSLGYLMTEGDDIDELYLALGQFTGDAWYAGDTSIDLARLLQSWLYFDILRLVFQDHYRIEDFIVDRPTPSLSTHRLEALIDQKHRSNRRLRRRDRERACERIAKLLHHAERQVQNLEIWMHHPDTCNPDLASVLLSISVLTQTLCVLCTEKDEVCPSPLRGVRPSQQPIVRAMTLQRGWCPKQAVRLCESFSNPTLYYLACMPRTSNVDHAVCANQTQPFCIAQTVGKDFEGYHVVEGCGCELAFAINGEQMHSILARGGVPLVTASRTATGNIQLQYVEATPQTPYVAVSHLWSDGLGAQSRNCLPHCQLERLLQRIDVVFQGVKTDPSDRTYSRYNSRSSKNFLRRPISFWLDVYCVPLAGIDRSIDDLKRKAISRMTATYALAIYTLILDCEIQALRFEQSPTSIAAAVHLSSWRWRYWTHSELTLSQAPLLQMQHGPVPWSTHRRGDPIIEIVWRDESRMSRFLNMRVRNELIWVDEPQRAGYASGDSSHVFKWEVNKLPLFDSGGLRNRLSTQALFRLVWNDICDKTSSRPEDMHFILANLLNIDAAEVVRLPASKRMKAIVASFDRLPIGLIFDFFSPSIHSWPGAVNQTSGTGGDQWVPEFPGLRGKLREPDGQLLITPQGLRIERDNFGENYGVLICTELNPTIDHFALTFSVEISTDKMEKGAIYVQLDPATHAIRRTSKLTGQVYLILLELGESISAWNRGACVVVSHSDHDTIYSKYVCPLRWVKKMTDEDSGLKDCPAFLLDEEPSFANKHLVMLCDVAHWRSLRPIRRYDERASSRRMTPFICCVVAFPFYTTLLGFTLCALLPLSGRELNLSPLLILPAFFTCVLIGIFAWVVVEHAISIREFYLLLEAFAEDSPTEKRGWVERLRRTLPTRRAMCPQLRKPIVSDLAILSLHCVLFMDEIPWHVGRWFRKWRRRMSVYDMERLAARNVTDPVDEPYRD